MPILGVQSTILKQVIEYMNRHKGTEPPIIEKPLRSKKMKVAAARACARLPHDSAGSQIEGSFRTPAHHSLLTIACLRTHSAGRVQGLVGR